MKVEGRCHCGEIAYEAIVDFEKVDFGGPARYPASVTRSPRAAPEAVGRILGIAVATAIACWLTLPAWKAAPLAGVDTIVHVMRTTFGVEQVFARGRVEGWFPAPNLGYELFLIRGPGLALATGLVKAASVGALSTLVALNVVVLAAFIAVPAAVALAVDGMQLGGRAAGIAAVLSLGVSYPFTEGIVGLFGLGLMENQLGALFFWFAVAAVLRVLARPTRAAVVVTGGAVAALSITHMPSTMVFVPLIGLIALVMLRVSPWPTTSVRLLVRAALVAAGLVAFWLVPFVVHRDLVGLMVGGRGVSSLAEDVRGILLGDMVYRPRVGLVIVAAWLVALLVAREHRTAVMAAALTCALYLVGGHWLYHVWPSELTEQVAVRGTGYIGVLATFPLALVLARVGGVVPVLGDALAVGAAAALVLLPIGALRPLIGSLPDAPPVLRASAEQLALLVPPGARFATPQHIWYSPDSIGGAGPGPDRWLSWASGRASLSGLTGESTSTPWVGGVAQEMDAYPPEQVADTLARLGVTHVVAPTPALAARLLGSGRFVEVWRQSQVAILAVTARPGHPKPASLVDTDDPARAVMTVAEPERRRFEITTDRATRVRIAIAWSPKWQGRINGDPIPLQRTAEGLIEVALAPGQSRLELEFGPDRWDRLGHALTAVSLVTVVALAIAHRRG